MPPWFDEVLRVVAFGSGTSWFGLVCPAHCGASLPYLLALFLSGLCLGVVLTLGFGFYLSFWFFHNSSVTPSPPQSSHRPRAPSRLLAYLYERPLHPGQRD